MATAWPKEAAAEIVDQWARDHDLGEQDAGALDDLKTRVELLLRRVERNLLPSKGGKR